MKQAALIILGVVISSIGIINLRGDISTVRWYNRRKVTPETAPKYGRSIGTGTLIMGFGLILTGVLELIFELDALDFIGLAAFAIGIGFILYGQIKYNGGIF